VDKDYTNSIISGFATTGLFPLDPERVLRKLPPEEVTAETGVEAQLLEKLSDMRYGQGPPTKRAPRPTKKDKLPAGMSYTCNRRDEEEESDGSSEDDDDPELVESSEDGEEETDEEERRKDEQRSKNVRGIIKRLEREGKLGKKQVTQQEEDDDGHGGDSEDDDGLNPEYLPDTYVAAGMTTIGILPRS